MIINLLTIPVAVGAVAMTVGQASAAGTMESEGSGLPDQAEGRQAVQLVFAVRPREVERPTKSNGTCNIVKGPISPTGWCKYYAKEVVRATAHLR